MDEAAAWAAANPSLGHTVDARSIIARRRDMLADEVAARYGVTLYPHPRQPHAVVVSASDYAVLADAVMADRRLSAVGRGYYLYLGGELSVVVAPDWACDLGHVALLRARVQLVDVWARPVVRGLSLLLDGVPALRPWVLAVAVSLALGSTVAIAAVAGAVGASGTG